MCCKTFGRLSDPYCQWTVSALSHLGQMICVICSCFMSYTFEGIDIPDLCQHDLAHAPGWETYSQHDLRVGHVFQG